MKRKIISAMLIAFTLSTLTACGAKDKGQTQGNSTEIQQEASTDISTGTDITSIEDPDDITRDLYTTENDINGISYSEEVFNDSVTGSDDAVAGQVEASAGDLDNARKEWILHFYDDDEEAAQDDIEAAQALNNKTDDKVVNDIIESSDLLAKSLAKFDITDYDLTRPYDMDEDSYAFDMYNSDHTKQFYFEVYYEGDKISDMLFLEE